MLTEATTWGSHRMANGEDQRSTGRGFVDLSASYLPTLKVLGVCAAVALGSSWATDLSNNVEQTRTAVTQVQTSLSSNQAQTEAKIEMLEKQVRELQTDLRLLEDYTEGRIGNLPYRPISVVTPSTEGGSR